MIESVYRPLHLLQESVVFMVLFGAFGCFENVLLREGKEIHSFVFYSHFGLLVSSFYFSGGILNSHRCIFYFFFLSYFLLRKWKISS